MYYDEIFDSAFNDESSVEFKLRQKEAAIALKKLDKRYEKYSVPFNNIWTDGKYRKHINIEMYGSGEHRTLIRNAVTGARYDILVGCTDEDILFKVTDSTGRNSRREPLMLYYDTPEQYENHQLTKVSTEVKQNWLKKSLKAQQRLNM
jgi:hypothetical protein